MRPQVNIGNMFDITTGSFASNCSLNGGFRRGELAMISAFPSSRPSFNMMTSMRLREVALSFPPKTPERYNAVAAYYGYGNLFIVRQEAPGERPTIGWMDWEGGCPDFGEDIKFMLDGTQLPRQEDPQVKELFATFAKSVQEAKANGTLIEIDSIARH